MKISIIISTILVTFVACNPGNKESTYSEYFAESLYMHHQLFLEGFRNAYETETTFGFDDINDSDFVYLDPQFDTCTQVITFLNYQTKAIDSMYSTYDNVPCGRFRNHRQGRVTLSADSSITTPFQKIYIRSVQNDLVSRFQIGDYKIEGTLVVTSIGYSDSSHIEFKVTSDEIKISDPTDHQILFTGDFTYTISLEDESVSVEGFANGVDMEGVYFEGAITETLSQELTCDYFSQGTVELKADDLQPQTLNFGSGTCDAKVDVQLPKSNKSIDLP